MRQNIALREAQAIELEKLNSERRRFRLPEYAGFRTSSGIGLAPEDGAEPIYEISGGADGIFYRDLREPHIVLDESAITLATTQKALWVYARTQLPANYWRVGKVVKLTAFGKATTDGTAGNYVFGIGYGASDAPAGTVVGVSAAAVVSRTNDTWVAQGYAECRAIGATGTIRAWGSWSPVVSLMLSTAQPYLIPGTAPADTTIDTTVGTNSLVFELQRSGAGVYTATTTNLLFEALN